MVDDSLEINVTITDEQAKRKAFWDKEEAALEKRKKKDRDEEHKRVEKMTKEEFHREYMVEANKHRRETRAERGKPPDDLAIPEGWEQEPEKKKKSSKPEPPEDSPNETVPAPKVTKKKKARKQKAKKQLRQAAKKYEEALLTEDPNKIQEALAEMNAVDNIYSKEVWDARFRAEANAARKINTAEATRDQHVEIKFPEPKDEEDWGGLGVDDRKERAEKAREERKEMAEFEKEIKKQNKLKKQRDRANKKKKGRKKKKKKEKKPKSTIEKISEGGALARTFSQRLKTRGYWFLAAAAENPERTFGKVLLNVLSRAGPQGFMLAGAITTLISSPEVVKAIVKVLGMKGGPLNMDWRRLIEDEVTGILSLEQQKRRDLGLDGFMVSPDVGFKPVDESSVYNSVLLRDEIRLNKLSAGEKVQTSR